MTHKHLSFILAVLLLAGTRLAAQVASDATPAWHDRITVNGFVSTGFTYNLNRPDTGRNMFRVFDGADNTFTMDVFELSLKRDAAAPGEAGFRVDLTAGASIPPLTRSAGMSGGDVDVQQLYVSWMAPIGEGLRLDFGKFVTPHGYELIEGYDGFNDNYSRSFLFGYAIPFTHTGLRATYAASSSLSFMCMVVNGWDNVVDNNTSKTLGAQIIATPLPGLSIYANYITGPERAANSSDSRSVLDLCLSYAVTDALTLGANADLGSEAKLVADEDAAWTGFAGYLRYVLGGGFAISLRGEMFDDSDGARTGVAQKLTEFTITPEYRPGNGLVFRAEFRMDTSDMSVFQKAGEMTDSQTTIGLNALYSF